MTNPWFRLWVDMVNDPKWRTISRISDQSIGDVIATYVHMMTCASNANNRGCLDGWSDEDVATALDVSTEQVTFIRNAMQGRVLDGNILTGWEKRQPKREREDNSANRVAEFRANKQNVTPCNAKKNHVTPCNANDNQKQPRREKRREEEIREDNKDQKIEARGTRLPSNWVAEEEYIEFCKTERPDLDPIAMQEKFRDYWTGVSGRQGLKSNWLGTWRNFVRSERKHSQIKPYESEKDKSRRELIEGLTGRKYDDKRTIDV